MHYVNVDQYYERLEKASRKFYLKFTRLQAAKNADPAAPTAEDIVLLSPNEFNPKLPALLIAAGFHGDEPAGYMGILAFMESTTKYWGGSVNVSFLPIMNVDGARNGRRNGKLNQMTNAGYFRDLNQPSLEGRILLHNLSMLEALARDGFLTLHEDDRNDMFYMYTYTRYEGQTDNLVNAVLATGKRYFRVQQSGYVVSPGNPMDQAGPVRNGVITNIYDGSFEDRLFSDGTKHAVTTETPANGVALDLRIQANLNIIETTLDYFTALSKSA